MPEWLIVALLAMGAGFAMPLGATLAVWERIRPTWLEDEFRHAVIAFGGGALLAAVALVLVPEGTKHVNPWLAAMYFGAGGLAFMGLDILLMWYDTPGSQLVAMLSDFIPEALALGAAIAANEGTGALIAGLIALQNFPEGFNAYRELSRSSHFKPHQTIAAFGAMAFVGVPASLVGYFWLAEKHHVVSGIMLFAAGGILYLVFQDVAPQAKLTRRWAPSLGAVAGFLLGMIGELLTR